MGDKLESKLVRGKGAKKNLESMWSEMSTKGTRSEERSLSNCGFNVLVEHNLDL